jgi:Tfp pilus assembly protein PilF
MGSNFYVGNHRGADGGYTPMRAGRGDARFERDDMRRLAEDAGRRPLSPAEVSRYWMARAWDDIRSAPAEWGRLLLWKWFLTWNRIELVDAEAFHTHARESPPLALLGGVLHFGVLLPLAVAGVWWTRRAWRRLWVLHAMALTFAGSVTLFYVFARYRYPLVPIAALFAGAGLEGFWHRLRTPSSRDGREIAIAVALVIASAVFANWPTPQRYDDDAITWYNAGTALLDAGRVDDARALLERARSADPRFPETYNNLGRAWLALGDVEAARRQLERGIELAPDHAILHLNLAAAVARQGDAARTRQLLERAIALDPLLAAAYGPLAELELRDGDAALAFAHLRRAVELTPESAVAHADLAIGWLVQGQVAEAVSELRAALRLDPGLIPVRQRLAWILATSADPRLRDGREALELAESLCRDASCGEPELLQTLAAAHAATGAFDEAARVAARGAEQARGRGDAVLADRLERHRSAYLARRALQEGPVTAGSDR